MIPKCLNNPELNEIRRKYQAVIKKQVLYKEVKKQNSKQSQTLKQLYEKWEENSKC